ncbi:MAG TPA: transglutaminase domain-containing protein, partial [Lachnospiraceae bacterium]|nr:transglutaminase domain-containing protein [Lachnospiraceae bacterium]
QNKTEDNANASGEGDALAGESAGYSSDSAAAASGPSDSGQADTSSGLSIENTDGEYEAPDISSLVLPDQLKGLTGYEPVQDTGEEIKKKDAEKLKDTIGYGNTGDGLAFDAEMYPYYQMLDESLKSLYRQIYANTNDMTETFVPVETVSASRLKTAFMALVNDHPELFWLDTAYVYKYTSTGAAEMDLQFNNTADDIDSSKELFNNGANEILSGAKDLSNAYDKEVYVHDRLLDSVSYQLSAPMNQSAYSALVGGKTVCAGYARAFQYLMQQLSVPCYYCTGYAGEDHAWDIIKLDDGYYNVDTTWDDTDPNTYDYFNCSDADYAEDHVRKELSVYLPPCNGGKYRGLLGADAAVSEEEQKRTLQDAGFSEEQVLNDIKEYYDDCYTQLTNQNETQFTFQNVVKDEALLQEIYAAYKNEGYKSAFMDRFMQEKGIDSCSLNVTVEELDGGYFLISHQVGLPSD